MANDCLAHVQACAIRIARLEANGVPDPGANNLYVSDSLTSLAVDPQIEEGDEFIVKNACGETCVNVKDCDRLKRINLTLGLCKPDPELLELLTGGVRLVDGAAVGYGFPSIGAAGCPNGVSVELWAKRYTDGGSLDGTFPYAWYVIPKAFFAPGRQTFENGPITVELTGFAVENENWFDGPLNDWPVDSDRVMQWIPTAALPVAQCGYQSIAVS